MEQYPDSPLPAAYVGVFNNRAKPRFNFSHLRQRLADANVREDVQLLAYDTVVGV